MFGPLHVFFGTMIGVSFGLLPAHPAGATGIFILAAIGLLCVEDRC